MKHKIEITFWDGEGGPPGPQVHLDAAAGVLYGDLACRHPSYGSAGSQPFGQSHWRRFRQLAAAARLWDWAHEPHPEDQVMMVDGPFWSADIIAGRRRLRLQGSSFHGRFPELLRLLQNAAG